MMRPLANLFHARLTPNNAFRMSRTYNSNYYHGGNCWNGKQKHPSRPSSAEYTTRTKTTRTISNAAVIGAAASAAIAAAASLSSAEDNNLLSFSSACRCLDDSIKNNHDTDSRCPRCAAACSGNPKRSDDRYNPYQYLCSVINNTATTANCEEDKSGDHPVRRESNSPVILERRRSIVREEDCEEEDSGIDAYFTDDGISPYLTDEDIIDYRVCMVEDSTDLEDEEFTETFRYLMTLQFHREMLPDYKKAWSAEVPEPPDWPPDIPNNLREVLALEYDLAFCEKTVAKAEAAAAAAADAEAKNAKNKKNRNLMRRQIRQHHSNIRKTNKEKASVQNLEFRIASYYLLRDDDVLKQKEGYKIIKKLAEQGHPDGMCLYGIILKKGRVPGVDANPKLAARWFTRCMNVHNHIQSIYEYAIALYTGEGVPEDTVKAAKLYLKAANNCHSGAQVMLFDCFLNGIGTTRDRASALEWLIDAAQHGHPNAQNRVISILENNKDEYHLSAKESLELAGDGDLGDSAKIVTLERKMSIGGGSGNPVILERRRSIVRDSRGKPSKS